MPRNKYISDVVRGNKPRELYDSLTSRERSLIRICSEVEAYQGSFDRMIRYLKETYSIIKNGPTAREIISDIRSLRKLKKFEEKYNISFYCYPGGLS